jgi:predicted nucleic acid-binding Zn ribbon protein
VHPTITGKKIIQDRKCFSYREVDMRDPSARTINSCIEQCQLSQNRGRNQKKSTRETSIIARQASKHPRGVDLSWFQKRNKKSTILWYIWVSFAYKIKIAKSKWSRNIRISNSSIQDILPVLFLMKKRSTKNRLRINHVFYKFLVLEGLLSKNKWFEIYRGRESLWRVTTFLLVLNL